MVVSWPSPAILPWRYGQVSRLIEILKLMAYACDHETVPRLQRESSADVGDYQRLHDLMETARKGLDRAAEFKPDMMSDMRALADKVQKVVNFNLGPPNWDERSALTPFSGFLARYAAPPAIELTSDCANDTSNFLLKFVAASMEEYAEEQALQASDDDSKTVRGIQQACMDCAAKPDSDTAARHEILVQICDHFARLMKDHQLILPPVADRGIFERVQKRLIALRDAK